MASFEYQQQKRLYPITRQAMIKIKVENVCGISKRTVMPAPKQNSINPHTLFIIVLRSGNYGISYALSLGYMQGSSYFGSSPLSAAFFAASTTSSDTAP